MSETQIDQRAFREALSAFVTGVTVVTTRDDNGVCHGVTANSFSSVSLDPPLILWSQAVTSRSYPAFRDSEHFAVNVLAENQVTLSNHFAKSRDDKFNGVQHTRGHSGVPVLDGVAAHFECTKVATYPGGDHVVYLGRVERMSNSGVRPLAFGAGKYLTTYAHHLDPVSLQLGTSAPVPPEALRLVIGMLPGIAEELGQYTLCVVTWGNHGPTAIHWEPSAKPVSNELRTGLVLSTTRSAAGLAFAAFLPAQQTQALVEEDLRQWRVAAEPKDAQRARFDDEIARIRRDGIARALGSEPSVMHPLAINAFSVPIMGRDGHMLMALSLACGVDRLDPDCNGPVPQALKKTADEISRRVCALGS